MKNQSVSVFDGTDEEFAVTLMGLGLKRNVEKHLKSEITERFLRKSQLEIYKSLGVSPRYTLETLYLPLIDFNINLDANIQVINQAGSKSGETMTKYKRKDYI